MTDDCENARSPSKDVQVTADFRQKQEIVGTIAAETASVMKDVAGIMRIAGDVVVRFSACPNEASSFKEDINNTLKTIEEEAEEVRRILRVVGAVYEGLSFNAMVAEAADPRNTEKTFLEELAFLRNASQWRVWTPCNKGEPGELNQADVLHQALLALSMDVDAWVGKRCAYRLTQSLTHVATAFAPASSLERSLDNTRLPDVKVIDAALQDVSITLPLYPTHRDYIILLTAFSTFAGFLDSQRDNLKAQLEAKPFTFQQVSDMKAVVTSTSDTLSIDQSLLDARPDIVRTILLAMTDQVRTACSLCDLAVEAYLSNITCKLEQRACVLIRNTPDWKPYVEATWSPDQFHKLQEDPNTGLLVGGVKELNTQLRPGGASGLLV